MTGKPSSSQSEVNNITDPLFIHAEHIAKDFSLFPDDSLPSNTDGVEGLIDSKRIKSNLATIKSLDVDAYIARTVTPAESNKRPGAKSIIEGFNGKIITEQSNGAFYSAEMDLDFGGYSRRIGFIAQERSSNNGAWMPEHHLAASKAIRKFADLSLPIVYLIDTPGADAGEEANSQNQAHTISQMITESANVDVPTIGVVVGVGYSGGAIPLATANILLSVRDGIFNTIQPKGLQSIARKYNLSWQECAQSVGVSPEELLTMRCIDGIVDYSPVDQDERQHNLQKAIVSGILSIESKSVEFVREYPALLQHYNRSLTRYLEPSMKLAAIENATDSRLLARNPTSHNNAFGTTYRYMRYLTLRSRIKAIQKNEYGRLSKLTVPEGDLKARIEADRKQIFLNWLENPDKLIYDDRLNKNWKTFLQKREDKSVERNVLTKLILGEPKANYDNARSTLMINLTWSLYNRWKTSAENNFHSLIKHLENEVDAPLTDTWPELAELNIIDAVSHTETRECFLIHCRHMLVFNALYDNTMGNLASIAKEAMATKELSRESVSSLVRSSLKAALSKVSDDDYEQLKITFNVWLQYFTEQSERGEILAKVEEWKSIGAPQMNSSLFVILTYIFEKLLPEYYNSRDDESSYNGAINPVRIGRRKDFWNRLTMGYQDLLIQAVLRSEKNKKNNSHQAILEKFFVNFKETRADLMTANLLEFPGFRLSVEDALDKNIKPCGLITGTGEFKLESGEVQRVGVAVSNLSFQAGAFDMASAEKFCALLVRCAKQHLPVIAFISSGGMQTKEGAAALFSMSVVNDRITRFIRDNDLPVVMFGYGDCTGGAQASFVTHPMAQTYYFSGTNMPFAGQMVVPAYLPSTSTLSNYLSRVPGAMDGLVINPFSDGLNDQLREIDENMPMPVATVEETIQRALSGFVPVCNLVDEDKFSKSDPRQLMHPVKKVLIHARGCTAVKLIRVAKRNNINVVLVASDPDMTSVPADMLGEGDKLVCLGGNTSDESYLNASSVLKVAEYEQVDALHPGIGFLSESPQFADLCISHNVNFVGPSMNSMLTMGNKSNAIKTAQANGVPVVPGSHGILSGAEQALDIANSMGYPVLLKAVNGGGGKGILVINKAEDMFAGFNQVSAEARSAFGNGDLYLEKYITSLRHIEVQLLRDTFGNTKVLGIRDCSVQRNNQKVVEESASTMLPERLEKEALKHTAALADAVDYMGAGTVEFIYDLDADDIYFMEMNTRLQVEHPVTEATSCIDIVKAQYDIASGADISDLEPQKKGYAIEVRVTAEKAAIDSEGIMQLLPHPGKVIECIIPEQDDVEIMSMIATGKEVSPYYDSLVAQFICHGKDRNDTVKKLLEFLDKVSIKGIATNIPLLQRILKDETFLNGDYDTTYLPKFMAKLDQQVMIDEMEASASSGMTGAAESIQVDGSNELKVIAQSAGIFYRASSPAEPDFVVEGDIVGVEQTLGLMEAMKMFSPITLSSFNRKDTVLYDANTRFRIERIINTNGQQVSSGDLLYIITPL